MKTTKIIYWLTTALVALMMSFSAFAYLTQEEIKQGFHHLGFPDYFRIELAIAKLVGAIVLLVPLASKAKEWAYAGFAITFVSAFIAHMALHDPMANRMGPILFLLLLAISYGSFHQLQKGASKAKVSTRELIQS
jgi:uncharacterized membrane protein YphA (DoxX/SURF4 family)